MQVMQHSLLFARGLFVSKPLSFTSYPVPDVSCFILYKLMLDIFENPPRCMDKSAEPDQLAGSLGSLLSSLILFAVFRAGWGGLAETLHAPSPVHRLLEVFSFAFVQWRLRGLRQSC